MTKGEMEQAKRLEVVIKEISKQQYIYDIAISKSFYKFVDGYYQRVDWEEIQNMVVKLYPISTQSFLHIVKNFVKATLNNSKLVTDREILKNWFVCKNGILNVSTRQFEPEGKYNFWLTNKLDVSYRPEIDNQEKLDKINNVFDVWSCNNDDVKKSMISTYANVLIPTNAKSKAMFLLGEGENGKSSYTLLIIHILGLKNVSQTPISKLSGSNNTQANYEIHDKLLNFSNETGTKDLLDTAKFKDVVDARTLNVKALYKDSYTVETKVKHIHIMNQFPSVSDTTKGFWRKVSAIPFNQDLSKLAGSNNLDFESDILFDEDIKSIVFNWMLNERDEIVENGGVYESQLGKDLINKQRNTSQSVQFFLYNDESKFNGTKEYGIFYNEYCMFCEDEGLKTVGKKRFGEIIEMRKDIRKFKSGINKVEWIGVEK